MNKKGPPTKRPRYPSTKHLDIETCNYLIRNKERWTTSNDDKNIVAVVEKDEGLVKMEDIWKIGDRKRDAL